MVALDQEAYDRLKRLKKPGESFSEVVKRVTAKRRPLTDLAGIWKDYPAEDFDRFQQWRRLSREADLRRQRRLLKRSE